MFVCFNTGQNRAIKGLPEECHCPHNAAFESTTVPRPALNNSTAFWRGDALMNWRALKRHRICGIIEKANANPHQSNRQTRCARERDAHVCRGAVRRALNVRGRAGWDRAAAVPPSKDREKYRSMLQRTIAASTQIDPIRCLRALTPPPPIYPMRSCVLRRWRASLPCGCDTVVSTSFSVQLLQLRPNCAKRRKVWAFRDFRFQAERGFRTP